MAKLKRRNFTAEFKEVVLEALSGESSQAELCRRHNLSEDQLSKWKQQFLENAASVLPPRISNPTRRRSGSPTSSNRWAVPGVRHPKKSLDVVELTPSESANSLRHCGRRRLTRFDRFAGHLWFTRSNLYDQPKKDPCERPAR